MSLKTWPMAVACLDADGESDIFFCVVACTDEEADREQQRDAAIKAAEAEGYDTRRAITYCELDPASAVLAIFAWGGVMCAYGIDGTEITDMRPDYAAIPRHVSAQARELLLDFE